MRIVLVAAVALGLSGCADSDFIDHPVTSLIPSLGSDEPARVEAPPANAHCRNLAKLRAGDAAFAGEDTDTQRAVYDSTLRDCMAWEAKHKS